MLFIFFDKVLYFSIIKKILFMNKQDFDNLSKIQTEVWNLQSDFKMLSARQMGLTNRLNDIVNSLDNAMESIRRADAEETAKKAAALIVPPPLPVQEELASAPVLEAAASAPVSETAASAQVLETAASAPEKVAALPEPVADAKPEVEEKKKKGFDLERFIGENLMSKIGVLIILIGVSIFGKYAIDNDLISPLGRVLCGAGLGAALVGVGLGLKKSVERLSSILVAGGTAVLYLMTYFAYDFYHLMPVMAAGGVMVLISAFTIWSAIHYKSEVIAVYGQLCAYLVPILVGGDSGNLLVFLGYVVVINVAITVVSVANKWHVAYLLSFVITWIVVAMTDRRLDCHGNGGFAALVALVAVNMVNYYVSMAWIKEKDGGWISPLDNIMVVVSTLLFFVVGYHQAWDVSGYNGGKLAITIITLLLNALLAGWLYMRGDAKCRVLGDVALACAALAVGYMFFDFMEVKTYVIMWSLLMAVLYYSGVSRNSKVLRTVAEIILPGVLISLVNLLLTDLMVSTVISMLLVAVVLSGMVLADVRLSGKTGASSPVVLSLAAFLVLWMAAVKVVMIVEPSCLIAYCMVTLAVAEAAYLVFSRLVDFGKSFRDLLKVFAILCQVVMVPAMMIINHSDLFSYPVMRYLSWALLAVCFWLNFMEKPFYVVLTLTSAIAVSSLEVYDLIGGRLSLSIWWGICAVACMYYGLMRKEKLFRVYGIVVLAFTLIKLMFFDLSHLSSIAKVVVFVVLGVIMLIGTFFYQKISKEESGEKKEESKE